MEKVLVTAEGKLEKATLRTRELATLEPDPRDQYWKTQQGRDKDILA